MKGALVAFATILSFAGCGAGGPVCGDGLAEEGEDELTCCADTGCERGVCDPEEMACVDPWELSCPERTGACSSDRPYVCDSAGPPSYDCQRCGCPEGKTCAEGVCYAPEVLELERTEPLLPDDLLLDEYFAFIDRSMSAPAFAYEELPGRLDALLSADARRSALLLGESHLSPDEKAVGRQIMRDLEELGWDLDELAVEGGDSPILDAEPLADLFATTRSFDGDRTNDVHCQDAAAGVGDALNDDGIYVQYSGSGHTSYEACHHLEHWPICELPHTAECVTSLGRKAITVILFDPEPWLWNTDRTLLWRLGPLIDQPASLTSELDASIARFDQSMKEQAKAPEFDATVDGSSVNVRVREADHAEDVFIAFFPRPGRPAYLLETFRAAWSDAALRQFMVAHGLAPTACSISWNLAPGEEKLYLGCSKDGYELSATVDGNDFSLLESDTSEPQSAAPLARPPEHLPSTDALPAPG